MRPQGNRNGWTTLVMVALTTTALPFVAEAQGQTAGQGNLYTCRDQSGRALTSDRPIPECAGVMRELSPSGVVRREIAPPMTADQLRQKDADDRSRRLVEESVREQHRRDIALLAAYQSEDQIEVARRRALVDTNDSIRTSKTRLDDLQKEREALAQESDTYRGKPSPLFRRKVEDNQMAIDDELAAIRQRQGDIERVNQRYDEEKRRYRELTMARK